MDEFYPLGMQFFSYFQDIFLILSSPFIPDLAKKFDTEPDSLRLVLGDTAVFQCLIEGFPSPTISWYKGSTRLQSSNVIRIFPSGTPIFVLHCVLW